MLPSQDCIYAINIDISMVEIAVMCNVQRMYEESITVLKNKPYYGIALTLVWKKCEET
jgi:hypothetical protein